MVRRVFVEKRKGFDVEAKGLFEDIKNNLDISGLKDIRVINRYDIEGLDEATYINAKTTVFSEPAIDMVYDEKLPENIGINVFATAYPVSYTHLRAHETRHDLVCRLLLEKKKQKKKTKKY